MRVQRPGGGGWTPGAVQACLAQPWARGPGTSSLVIGIGNPLRGDDGIGWRLAAQLPVGSGLVVRCCQQLTPELAADLALVERVLFLDAWLEPAPGHQAARANRRLGGVQPQSQPPHRLQLTQIGALGEPGPSMPVWAGAAPWGGASHGLSPFALLALSQALYGQAPRAHQLLLPAHGFGHGEGISPALAGRLAEARRLIGAWIAAGSALQGGGRA